MAGIEPMTNTASCQLPSTFASYHWKCVKFTIPMTCPRLHWTTDNPPGMHRCQFQHLIYGTCYHNKSYIQSFSCCIPFLFLLNIHIFYHFSMRRYLKSFLTDVKYSFIVRSHCHGTRRPDALRRHGIIGHNINGISECFGFSTRMVECNVLE